MWATPYYSGSPQTPPGSALVFVPGNHPCATRTASPGTGYIGLYRVGRGLVSRQGMPNLHRCAAARGNDQLSATLRSQTSRGQRVVFIGFTGLVCKHADHALHAMGAEGCFLFQERLATGEVCGSPIWFQPSSRGDFG